MMQAQCPFCKFPVSENFLFCPNCGKKIKSPPLSITIGKQIYLYLISIFLPPFGLFPGIKYASQPDRERKIIGFTLITLTILSTAATAWFTINFMSILNTTLNTQLGSYKNIGL